MRVEIWTLQLPMQSYKSVSINFLGTECFWLIKLKLKTITHHPVVTFRLRISFDGFNVFTFLLFQSNSEKSSKRHRESDAVPGRRKDKCKRR